jgi:hypothetical protein
MWRDTALDTIDTMVTLVSDSTVDNAAVTITGNGASHDLVLRDSGWYRDADGGLVVAVGQTYRIDVVADGRHAWAQTTVPAPVGRLSVSRDTLYTLQGGSIYVKPPIIDKSMGKEKPPINPTVADSIPDSLSHLVATWRNPDRAYLYYRCIQDTNLPYTMRNGNYTMADSLKIVSAYSRSNGKEIFMGGGDTAMQVVGLMQPGRYKLFLFSTTPDYRTMLMKTADTTNQDLWSKSPNNIHGGLGFFTSFSADSASFTIIGKVVSSAVDTGKGSDGGKYVDTIRVIDGGKGK